MEFTKQAEELFKRFRSGVSCPAKKPMFYDPCVNIAKKMGKSEIDEIVAKKYIFNHNSKVVSVNRGNIDIEKIKSCMVLVREKDGELAAFHGTAFICYLTEKEAEFLKKEEKRLLGGL